MWFEHRDKIHFKDEDVRQGEVSDLPWVTYEVNSRPRTKV